MFQQFLSLPRGFLHHLGRSVLLLGDTLHWVVQGRIRWQESVVQAARIGVESIPMVIILASIGGGVMSLQLCNTIGSSGGDAYVGLLVAAAVIREVAPIFTALSLAARCGTALASELAHMKISNQVDAIQVLQVCPNRYLIVPRLLACVLMTPLLCMLVAVVAVVSGMLVAKLQIGMTFTYYLNSIYTMLPIKDIWQLVLKGLVFGTVLGVVSASFGMSTVGGSKNVGLAAMKTAVWVSITVLLIDVLLTWVFKALG